MWGQAPVPPSDNIKVYVAGTVPSNNAWGITINPGQIGGANNALVTTLIAPDPVPGIGTGYSATGFPNLQPGKQYTFSLSNAYGGSWDSNNPSFGYYGVAFYNVNDSMAGTSPNWLPDPSNPYLGGFRNGPTAPGTVSPATLASLHWTFTVLPWIRANVEDTLFSPPITTYVDYNQIVDSSGHMPLCIDYLIWSVPGTRLASIGSSRNTARGTVDTFAGTDKAADNTGLLKVKLNTVTYHTDPITINAQMGADKGLSLAIRSPATNILPVKCRSPYTCSVYYTPKEEGFTSPDFNVKMKSLPGVNFQVEADFKKAVTEEGCGRLNAAHGGKYLYYDSKSGNFSVIDFPLDNSGHRLTAHESCAVNNGEFPPKASLILNSPDVQKNAGSKNWQIVDTGRLSTFYQVDVYVGEDLPKVGDVYVPRSVKESTIYGVPVIIKDMK